MKKNAMIHVRVPDRAKTMANHVLGQIGMSTSEAVRLFLHRIVMDQAFPLELKVPNQKTLEAIQELEKDEGQRFDTVDALMTNLNVKD